MTTPAVPPCARRLPVARPLDEPPPAPPPPRGENCDQCGVPDDVDDKYCHGCGTARPPAAPPVAPAETSRKQQFIRCKSCGAEIRVDPNQRSYICPFCDSTYVEQFSPAETGRQEPEFVIGFAITPERALEKFRAWLADGWLRPWDLREAEIAGKLRGVYLPFWSFSLLAESQWSASIGEYWYRTETYTTTNSKGESETHTRTVTETEWWDLAGQHQSYYSFYLISASRGITQADAARLEPFHLPALKRYEPYFLAGWLCEEYSMPREEALAICKLEFERREEQAIGGFMPGDTSSNLAVNTQFADINSDLILLPVYLLSYRYRGKLHRFLLNGQTGRVAGSKPISGWRIGAIVGAVVVAIVIALLLIRGLAR